MKRIKLLLAAVLSVMAWGGAQAQTEAEVDAALEQIGSGENYRIYTLFDGAQTGDTKYYLKSNGYLTDDQSQAAVFNLTPAAGGDYMPNKGFKINQFTNGGDGSGNLTGDALTHIIRGGQNRVNYEGQVFFLNEEGDFAVRSTNANGSSWGENAFWTVVEDNDEDGLPNACYTLEGAAYVWKLEAEPRIKVFATVQNMPWKVQTIEGLVSAWTTNAQESTEGSIANIIDGNTSTFFHSQWSGTGPDEDHYIQTELPEAADKFYLYFNKRNNANRPTRIVVSSSNDGETFSEAQIIDSENGLPADAGFYTEIDLGAASKFVRLTVTNTNTYDDNNEKGVNNGHVYFTMSECYLLPISISESMKQALDYSKEITAYTDIQEKEINKFLDLDATLSAQAALVTNKKDFTAAVADARAFYELDSYTDEGNAAKTKLESTISAQQYIVNNATTAEEIANAIAAVKAASLVFVSEVTLNQGATIDLTKFIVNPTPYANANGWETSQTPNKFDSGNKNAEFWNQSAATIKQTIAQLPKGAYRLSVVALTRTNMKSYIFAGEDQAQIAQVDRTTINDRGQAGTWFDGGNGVNELNFGIESTTDITIGLTSDNTTSDYWTVWRSFKLEYTGSDPNAPYIQNYNNALDAAKAAQADEAYKNVSGSELTELKAAIEATPGSTKDELLTTIANLQSTTATFTAAKVNYDLYVSEAIIARTISSELIVDTPTSAEEALEKFKELKVAEFEYVADAYPHSATAKIGEFTTWERTGTVNGAEKNEFEALTSQHWSGQARTYYEQPATGYSNNAWTANYTKTTTLPAGNYIIKVAARAASGTATTAKIICSAAKMDGPIPNLSDTGKGITTDGIASFDEGTFCNEGNGRGWVWNYLPFSLTEKTEVTMTIVAEATASKQWFSVCDGELLSMDDIADKVNYKEDEVNTIEASELANVTIERNVVEGYNTVVLPFSLTAQQVQNTFGTGAEVYNFSENSENADQATVNFTKNVAGTIESNVPVLVKATAASEVQEFKGVEVVAPAEGAAVEGTNFVFAGVFGPLTIDKGDFFLSDNKIYKSTGLSQLNAFRAYFINKTGVENVKLFIDGIATRISDINDAAAQNGVLYNLAGQRVSKAQKGIFIQNGKKVLK